MHLNGGHGLSRRLPAAGRFLAGVLTGLLAGAAAHANPDGPTVVHGSAHFAHPGANALDVTTSPNAIIHWQGFSIGADEVTRFIQQSASSAVLNRVTGADPSAILGQLLSNGRVFLVNPHGIVFGEGAVVDTAGLVASTLGISDTDFLAGRYRFDAGPDAGEVVNQGLIKAGAGGVFLLAPSVENSGVVRTAGGDLVLAAGRRITLTSLDLDGVRVEVQAPEDEALNLGSLIAERGAAGMFADSIRNAGTVEANAVTVGDDGVIRLVARDDLTLDAGGRVAAEGHSGGEVHVESERGTTWVSGEVSARASEGRGGSIRLLGDRVGLAGARIDASGPAGGGEVRIGGDVSGRGPTPTAEATYVSADSIVSADALASGDGGKVVVFAEGFANVQGRLSARGGPSGGAGGFVETSGRRSFAIRHAPDTTAPKGEGGHWLIDPHDIEIVAGSGNTNVPAADPFTSTGDSARLGIELLAAALSGGQSVTVQTAAGGTQGGDITLSTALDVEDTTGTNTLTLQAHDDVFINAPITDTAGGAELDLVLTAGEIVVFLADVTLRGGSLETRGGESTVVNAVVTVDGITWQLNNDNPVGFGIGINGTGTVVARNGALIDISGKNIVVGNQATDEDVDDGVEEHGSRFKGRRGTGTLIIESGSDVRAREIYIGADASSQGTVRVTGSGSTLTTAAEPYHEIWVGSEGVGALTIEDGADVRASRVVVGEEAGSQGTVTVTGSGSTLTTAGTDNEIEVGNRGTGTLEVLDGGLVDTLWFDVARSGVGRVTIRGVAADGTRSRVIVSPDNGRYSDDPNVAGCCADAGGFARVGRNAGSIGALEILEGGLLRVRDGGGTWGPGFQLARNKGSVGTLLIDGAGSSLEVIQSAPIPADNPYASGPYVQLGRRGGGTTTIRNGGRLLVRGEDALVQVSRDSVNPDYPDPDTGPIDQRSVVDILSGGGIEVTGESARFVIGDGGPAADGAVTVSGAGSTITVAGDGNALVVGDEGSGVLTIENGADVTARRVVIGEEAGSQGTVTVTGSGSTLTTAGTDNEVRVGDEGTGTLEVLDGGLVDTLWLEVARSGVGRATIRGVAADGTRSRVIVSPANGRYSDDPDVAGCCADEGGFARVGRNAGSRGALEILEGGLLRVRDGGGTWGPGFSLARNKGSVGTLLIDGDGSSLEVIQSAPLPTDGPYAYGPFGPYAQLGQRGGGTTTIRNGGRLLVEGEGAYAGASWDSVSSNYPEPDTGPINQRSVVNVLSGGTMEVTGENARLVIGDGGPAADGMVTVSGSGSTITTTGTSNRVIVGDEGTGVLEVLDGGLVDTLWLDVAWTGVGRATIRGIAADGTRSRVIVSPANGKFSGDFVDEGGFARAGRNAGSRGAIEILEGGLLRVLDGEGTYGPEFQLARNKGSVGTLLIDGAGSSLEVIQTGPAQRGNPNVRSGPTALLGRRGGGTTTIRNGGRLLVQGEDAFIGVSHDSVYPDYPDPDAGPIDQRSVVNVLSGGGIEVTGESARFVIGDGGPAAEGAVTVSGSGSTLTVAGEGNAIIVGDEGIGALTIGSGAGVSAARAVVGRKPGSRGTLRVGRGGALDAVTLLAVGKDFDFDHRTTQEPGGTGSAVGEAGSRVEYDALEVGTHGSTNLKEAEEVLTEEQVTESTRTNTDEIVRVQEAAVPESAVDSGEPGAEGETREEEPAGEEDGAQKEDGEDEEDEGSEEESEERSGAGESDEEEREELPMCPA